MNDLISNLQKAYESLRKSRGELDLFAILKMDEYADKWAVVVSAEWATTDKFESIFEEVRQLLIDNIGDEISTIGRISIYTTDTHLIELILQQYKTGAVISSSQQLNGNLIHEGFIIYAREIKAN